MLPSWSVTLLVAVRGEMQLTHKYHINTALTGTCIKQPFTILYMLNITILYFENFMQLSLMRKAPFIDSV
ncbi:hypothetical protein T09_2542 [Trichinella sp. T9]|nr:hypothetical protein T09_2542 [Trichinella sp. T9]